MAVTRLAAVVAGALVLLGVPPAARGAEGPGPTAVVVFLSYEGNRQLSVSPTELRRTAGRDLAAALEARGRGAVTYPEIEPVMREARIRSDRSLDRASLGTLAERTGAERVMIATLVLYSDRLVALAREIDAASGCLTFAEAVELPLDGLWTDSASALAAWRSAVAVFAERLAAESKAPVGDESTLAVLPMVPVGVAPGHADMALHCLLRSLLEAGRGRVPDPMLVRAAIRGKGFSPGALEPAAREVLSEEFGTDVLLLPWMVSFGQDVRANGPLLDEGEFETAEISLEPEARQPVYLSLLAVDCATGRVMTARDEYLEPENPIGLFGIARDIEVVARLKRGADDLVSILREIEGDS